MPQWPRENDWQTRLPNKAQGDDARRWEWTVRYTVYQEAMWAARDSVKARHDGRDSQSVDEKLGSPDLEIWQVLDRDRWPSPRERGALLADTFLSSVGEMFTSVRQRSQLGQRSKGPIAAWWALFTRGTPGAVCADLKSWGYTQKDGSVLDFASVGNYIWRKGWQRPSPKLPAALDVEALQRITEVLDEAFSTYLRPEDGGFDTGAPFAELVPRDLDEVHFRPRQQRLQGYHRAWEQAGVDLMGVSPQGLTTIEEHILPHLGPGLGQGASFLVAGPTSTGKTDLGMAAAIREISRGRKAILLLPTKALVAQTAEHWREVFERAEVSREWQVVETSRDYPFNDDRVARGDYHLLVAIPEKLAGSVAAAATAVQCDVLVVDELQMLASSDRGANLETLLTLFRQRMPATPIVALSATLDPQSFDAVSRWLGATGNHAFQTFERPVPLARYAVNDRDRYGGTPDMDPAHTDEWHLNQSEPVVSLVSQMLGGDQVRRGGVLVFVNSRRRAELLCEKIRDALKVEAAVRQPNAAAGPTGWRFGQHLDGEAADEWQRTVNALPPTRVSTGVRKGLETGVAYHSARLDPEHRRAVEDGYKQGLIQVLVATGTLAIGLNLPAAHVVVADIHQFLFWDDYLGKPVYRLLEPQEIIQRLGRCGRLGHAAADTVVGQPLGGVAYVFTFGAGVELPQLQLSEETCTTILRAAGQAGTPDLVRVSRATDSLRETEPVYQAMIEPGDHGQWVTSSLAGPDSGGNGDGWDAWDRLVLQDMSPGAVAYIDQELNVRHHALYQASLLAQQPDAEEPIAAEVRTRLRRKGLVELVDNRHIVTALGRTVALSNLPLKNTEAIATVAEVAAQGATEMTILFHAAHAPFIAEELTWIGLPNGVSGNAKNRMRDLVWKVVRRVIGYSATRLNAVESLRWLPTAATGIGTEEQRLKEILESRDAPTDLPLIAMLRAIVAGLWAAGAPVDAVSALVQNNTRVKVNNRSMMVDAPPADIRDLAERTSYLVNAASEVLRTHPDRSAHLRLRNLAESLRIGLPFQFAPLTALKERLHRDRLTTLIARRPITHFTFDDPGKLVTQLNTQPSDATHEEAAFHRRHRLSDHEIGPLVEELANQRRRRRKTGLASQLRFRPLPDPYVLGGGTDYQDMATSLEEATSATSALELVQQVLAAFAVASDVALVDGRHALLIRSHEESLTLLPVIEEVTPDILSQMRGPRLLLAFAGYTQDAEHHLREDPRQMSLMTPTVWLSALGMIHLRWAKLPADPDGDPRATLSAMAVAFMTDVAGPLELSDVHLAELLSAGSADPA